MPPDTRRSASPGHLETEELLQLLGSEPSGEGRLLHLLGCARCRARTTELAALDDTRDELSPTVRGEDLGAAAHEARLFARVLAVEARVAADVERDGAEADGLYHELMSRPSEEREQAIGVEPRFHSLGLARLLTAAGEEAATADPPRAEALGRLALAVGDHLAPRRFGATAIAEARAEAWSLLGDASRRTGKDPELAFRAAARELSTWPLEGRARAWFCQRLALLRRDQDRTDEALALLARAADLFEQLDDRAGLGAALAAEGRLRLEEGDLEGARIDFDRALDALGPTGRLGAYLDVQHGLAMADVEMGWMAAAQRTVVASRELYGLLPSERDRALALAREAKVAEASGRDREAERIRLQAIAELRAAGALYDAALVALDLARAYLEQERPGEVERLRGELAPLLTAPEINPQARLAIASAFTALHAATFSHAAAFVARSRHNPELAFRPCREASGVLVWGEIATEVRRDLCRRAEVAPELAELSSAEIEHAVQETISRTYQELTGFEILFEEAVR